MFLRMFRCVDVVTVIYLTLLLLKICACSTREEEDNGEILEQDELAEFYSKLHSWPWKTNKQKKKNIFSAMSVVNM